MYDRRNYQSKYKSNSGDRIQFSGQNRGRPRYEQNYRNDYRRGNFRGNMRMYQNVVRHNSRGDIKEIIRMKIITEKELEVGLENDIWTTIEGETGVLVILDQGQDQEQVQIEIELGVINVGNMIILWRIALPPREKEKWSKSENV